MRSHRQWPLKLLLLAAAGVLAACAGYSPRDVRPGMSAAEVVQQMGQPTGRYAQPDGGTRLEFARGPAGLHTFMVDLDASGRVLGWQQVLTEPNFNAIPVGLPVPELLRRLGHPAEVRGGGWQPGDVWSYRYDSLMCQWWQVDIVAGRTGRSAYGMDPRCLANEPRDRM